MDAGVVAAGVIFIAGLIFIVIWGYRWNQKRRRDKRADEANRQVQQQKRIIERQERTISMIRRKPFHNSNGTVPSGDSNSTVVNSAQILGSIENIATQSGSDLADALVEIAAVIDKDASIEAAELLEGFVAELEKEKPKKPVLKSLWYSIELAEPSVVQLATATAKVRSVFL